MDLQSYWLWGALLGAVIFPVLRLRGYSSIRPFVKSIMGVCLAVYCVTSPSAPVMVMAVGFLLSALGDFYLDLPEDKAFTPGLFAFFAAHIAFVVHLWPMMVPLHAFTMSEYTIVLVTIALNLGFFLWLRPSLDKELVIPVAMYSVIICLMGITAFTTTAMTALIPLGALMFIASDVVLSVEKFKFKLPMGKELNWVLYAGGQILLAIGVVSVAGGIAAL
ncbi:MAG: hypothetical protein COA69_09030 [Robiginitomaculum sp.]|nr:MAG: hypothetical protein COA69_09030 [Robiginitomaculum sp.]